MLISQSVGRRFGSRLFHCYSISYVGKLLSVPSSVIISFKRSQRAWQTVMVDLIEHCHVHLLGLLSTDLDQHWSRGTYHRCKKRFFYVFFLFLSRFLRFLTLKKYFWRFFLHLWFEVPPQTQSRSRCSSLDRSTPLCRPNGRCKYGGCRWQMVVGEAIASLHVNSAASLAAQLQAGPPSTMYKRVVSDIPWHLSRRLTWTVISTGNFLFFVFFSFYCAAVRSISRITGPVCQSVLPSECPSVPHGLSTWKQEAVEKPKLV